MLPLESQPLLNYLMHELNLDPSDELTAQRLTKNLTTAIKLVDTYLGTARETIPDLIRDEALLTVARELETRTKSPGGVFAAYGEQEAPIRLARDPLNLVYPLLRPFVGGGFA